MYQVSDWHDTATLIDNHKSEEGILFEYDLDPDSDKLPD